MDNPLLFRKRFIPFEVVALKDDELIYMDDEIIVTKWKTIKPRKDFTNGRSCYFLNEGYKVSSFIDENGKILYYYCDMIETHYNKEKNEYTFVDLLVDVIVYENNFVKVLDLYELPEAYEKKLITIEQMNNAIITCDKLLNIIYSGNFFELVKKLKHGD